MTVMSKIPVVLVTLTLASAADAFGKYLQQHHFRLKQQDTKDDQDVKDPLAATLLQAHNDQGIKDDLVSRNDDVDNDDDDDEGINLNIEVVATVLLVSLFAVFILIYALVLQCCSSPPPPPWAPCPKGRKRRALAAADGKTSAVEDAACICLAAQMAWEPLPDEAVQKYLASQQQQQQTFIEMDEEVNQHLLMS